MAFSWAGAQDAGADGCGAFAAALADEGCDFDGRDGNVDVDAIEQRPGEVGFVALARDFGAAAGQARVAEVAAGVRFSILVTSMS